MAKPLAIQWLGSAQVGVPLHGWNEVELFGIRKESNNESEGSSEGLVVDRSIFPVTLTKVSTFKIILM